MKLAFDWDGTLVHHGTRRPNYEDPVSIRLSTKPLHDGLQRAKAAMQAGAELHVVTGRGDHLRALTLAQIRLFLDHDFPAERLHNCPQWRGYTYLRAYKAERLNDIQPSLYVGDHHECDELAAADAGVPFMQAEKFREGFPFHGSTPWELPLLGAM